MICDKCSSEAKSLRKAVINGKFGTYCIDCRSFQTRQASAASAAHTRAVDRDKHAKDGLQPRNPDNTPNQAFIRAYRGEAEKIFNKQELETYG
jgi:ribosome-binding protein aMBF1 (putative translation factor)